MDDGHTIKNVGSFLTEESKKYLNDQFLLNTPTEIVNMKSDDYYDQFRGFITKYNEFYDHKIDEEKVAAFVSYSKENDKEKLALLNDNEKEYFKTIQQRLHKATRFLMADIYSGFNPKDSTTRLIDYTIGFSKYGFSEFKELDELQKADKLKELTQYINLNYEKCLLNNTVEGLYRNELIGDQIYNALICYKNSLDEDGKFVVGENHPLEFIDTTQDANERVCFIAENIKEYHNIDFSKYYDSIKQYARINADESALKDFIKNIPTQDFKILNGENKDRVLHDMFMFLNAGREEK